MNDQTKRDTAEASSRTYRYNQATLRDTAEAESRTYGRTEEAMRRFEARVAERNRRALAPDAAQLGYSPSSAKSGDEFVFSSTSSGGSATPSHPWKVTSNGDDSVTVGAGSILTWKNEPSPGISTIPSYINLEEVLRFEGGTLSGIDSSHTVIWARCNHTGVPDHTIFEADAASGITQIERVIPDSTNPFTLHSGTEMPTSGANEINLELAKITFSDNVISIDRQILTYNPPMWLIDIPPEI